MNLIKRFGANLIEISYNKLKEKQNIPGQGILSNTPGIGMDGVSYTNEEFDYGRQAAFPEWMFTARLGQPRSINIGEIRLLAKSVWAQMVINTFRKQILTTDWDIVPEDEEDETDYSQDIDLCKEKLNDINQNHQSVNSLSSETVTDIAEIDAGVWNYVYSVDSYTIGDIPVYDNWGRENGTELGVILKPLGQRELVAIKSVDGGSMLKQVDIYKNLLRYYQYSFKHPMMNPTMFEPDEISYMMLNAAPSKIYGFSPIQSAQQVIEALIQGTRWNKDAYKNNAIPDIIASLPKLPKDQLKKIKQNWLNEYKGKPHQVSFINWDIPYLHKLANTGRDMEWLKGLDFYKNVIFGVYGVSPTEAGFFENSNRSNDQGQERVTVRNALRPYYKLFEDIISKKVITEILQKPDHKLKFKWMPKDQEKEKIEFDQDIIQVKEGLMTPNEFRRKYGREEKENGDELRQHNTGGFGQLPFGNPAQNPNPAQPPKEEEGQQKGYQLTKQDDEVDAGDDVIDEAKDYAEFLNKTFDTFEKKTLKALDKLDKAYINKTFGQFLRDMFNSVNTLLFASKVKKYLKADLIAGMVSAESELNTDIGFTESYQQKLNQLASQQIDGYTINGKPWHGIKGVTKELQADIIRIVQTGVAEKKSVEDIKNDIKSKFDGFSDWRANNIGRTEVNRTISEGKLLGYKESGMKGKKVWSSAIDHRTSDICRRLNGQERNLDEPFVDPETNKEYMTTPGHCQCRSTIVFRPD